MDYTWCHSIQTGKPPGFNNNKKPDNFDEKPKGYLFNLGAKDDLENLTIRE